jgi:transcriptional regulator of acetoin/glycerol metabolism
MEEENQLGAQTDLKTIWHELHREWSKYVIKGIKPERIRPIILKSWYRCRDLYKVDPSIKKSPVSLSPEQLRVNREQNGVLHLARPYLDELTNMLKESGYVITFFDADGWMLEMQGDPQMLEALNEPEDYLGSNCKEQFVGTNGAGTALAEQRPLQVLGSEHYSRFWHAWAGYGAPILDPLNHEPLAVMEIAGYTEKAHPPLLSIVSMAARAVEQKIKQRQTIKDHHIVNDYLKLATKWLSDGLLCIDHRGRIVQINPAARRILGLPETTNTLEACADLEPVLLSILHRQHSAGDSEEHKIYCSQTDQYLNAVTFPVIRKGRAVGVVALLPNPGAWFEGSAFNQTREKPARRTGSNRARAKYFFENVLGEVAEVQQALRLARRAASNTLPVLLMGESGTGKEMIAQAIHNASPRAQKPFIIINCGAIPEELIEAELFGYEAGAFTGARRSGNAGKFEQADGGTIFLDEVSELSPSAQVALLRVLQEMEIIRLGSSLPIAIDVRVIAATNKNLRQAVGEQKFRRDLYYRLDVLTIELPPLRQRRQDIPILAHAILQMVAMQLGQPQLTLSQEALDAFLSYDWPGNVRELKNVIQRATAVSESPIITCESLPPELTAGREQNRAGRSPAMETMASVSEERKWLVQALRQCSGNISKTSRQLGLSRKTLYRKMKRYSISKLESLGA